MKVSILNEEKFTRNISVFCGDHWIEAPSPREREWSLLVYKVVVGGGVVVGVKGR